MRHLNRVKLVLLLGFLVPLTLLALACGASAAPEELVFSVKFAGGELAPDTIQAKQGDSVTLQIESDRPGTFHIHGYDLQKETVVGQVEHFTFPANATGRFLINFHGAAPEKAGAMDHGPMESATPISVAVAAAVEENGGVHVRIDTEGWRWAPEEVNESDSEGAGHAHIYVDGEKLSRVYGPYYYLPSLEPGPRDIKVSLNTNAHSELTWEGSLLEATTAVTIPEPASASPQEMRREPEPMVSDSPMSLEIAAQEDALGGYNLQVNPRGFEFSQSAGQVHQAGKGYAQLSINGEEFNRLYVPWLQVPAQGEGTHTFTVKLLNNAGKPYHYNGQPVEASVQVHEAAKVEDSGSAMAAGHHDSGSSQGGQGHHGGGSGSGTAGVVELEVGYLEVLPR